MGVIKSIRQRIFIYVAGIALLIGIVLSIVFYTREYVLLTEETADKGQVALNALSTRIIETETHANKLPSEDEMNMLAPGHLFDNVAIYIDNFDVPKHDLNHAGKYIFNEDLLEKGTKDTGYIVKDGHIYIVSPVMVQNVKMGIIVARMPMDLINKRLSELVLVLIGMIVAITLFAFFISRIIHSMVVRPVNRLATVAESITQQKDYSIRVHEDEAAELGGLYHNFNTMLDQISEQNAAIHELNTSLESKIEDRVQDLTKAKEESDEILKDAIKSKNQAEQLAKQLEIKQQFDHRVTEFNESMQSKSSENIESWAEYILKLMVEELGAVQGALYSASLEAGIDIKLRLVATFAYDQKTILKKTVKAGDGVAGQAVKEKRMIHLEEVPEDYLKIASTLGDSAPSDALVIPLIAEDQVQGLIEIGSFKRIEKSHIDFVNEVTESVAYTLLVIKNKDDIQRLLEESRDKNEQLMEREAELEKSQDQLKVLNESLEQQVQKRTEALTNTLEDLKSTQAQLVQSEKMASLGQLISGIAHEINTPIGAVKASAGNLKDSLPLIFSTMPELARKLEDKQFKLFTELLSNVLTAHKTLTSREERKVRKEIIAAFDDAGITNADDLGRTLVDIGMTADLEKYYPLFKTPFAEGLNEIIYNLGQLKVNSDNIETASERTKKIVFALKSYAYKQDDEEMIPVDLAESLDVILTLYTNQLKHGIELKTDYGDKPLKVMAFPDEIGQVWTNIITNALQALNYQGELKVSLKEEGERVSVTIADSGPGIPPDIQEKIFDPFFTTKRQGEGTGLGLDICKRIVEKHNGMITLASEPGNTVFRIVLPMAPEE